jgi:hypothetical protein
MANGPAFFTMPPELGFELRAQQIVSRIDKESIWQVFGLQYLLEAVAYHCKRLAELYSDVCYMHDSIPWPEPKRTPTLLGHAYDPWYEFDALITAARRTYNSMRGPVWNIFGKKTDCPKKLTATLRECTNIPQPLKERIEESWNHYGERLKKYRDCIQHYESLDFAMGSIVVNRIENGPSTALVRIPDNPEANSKKNFRYELGLDAQSYGWEIAKELLEVSEAIMGTIEGTRP